jgi:copper chaperone CopZ
MLRLSAAVIVFSVIGCAANKETTVSSKPTAVGSTAAPGSLALHVKGMGCPLCATNVRKSLERVPGVESVNIDLGAGVVKVSVKANQTPEESSIRKAVADAGFELSKVERL